MKKEKIKPAFLLFSAVLATIVFCFASTVFFKHSFGGFDLFSTQSWQHILGKWKSGWKLHTSREYLFFVALIALIPGYFITWFLSYYVLLKIKLLNPIDIYRRSQKKKLEARSLAAAVGPLPSKEKTSASKKPEKQIRISSQKMNQINQLRGKMPASSKKEETKETQNKAIEKPNVWERMAEKLKSGNAFVLRQMNIASVSFNLVAITQNALFLVCEGPSKGSVFYTADEASPAVWKTESGEIPSPVVPLINAQKTLQDYFTKNLSEYSNININCCMILEHGRIANMASFLPFLEKNNLSVLRTESCETEELPICDALAELINTLPASSQEMNDAVAVALLDLIEA